MVNILFYFLLVFLWLKSLLSIIIWVKKSYETIGKDNRVYHLTKKRDWVDYVETSDILINKGMDLQ